MKVTNNAKGPRTFQVNGVGKGAAPVTVTLNPGESDDLDLVTPDHPILKAWEKSGEVSFGKKGAAKKSDDEPDDLVAKHKGGGKFVIVRGNEVLAENLTKADADEFNALSDEEKEEFVAEGEKGE